MTGLTVRDVHVEIGGAAILNGASLRIPAGITVLVGRNGMGKSTLCNAIVGLREVSSGVVSLADVRLDSLSPHKIAREGVAYVPQGRRLFASLTVAEHMQIASRAGRRRTGTWTADTCYDLFPNLAEARKRRAPQLSGGEQQMLAISRALLTQPKLMVLDEPSEGIAPVIIDSILKSLLELEREGLLMLIVEQNMRVATALSGDVWVMATGQIVDHVESKELMENEEMQQRYLGVS